MSKVHLITTIKPICLSHGLMTLAASRGFYLYVEVLTTALNDGIVTDDEASILKVLSTALGVSPANTGAAMDIARGIDSPPFGDTNDFTLHHIGDATTYQSALVAALDDEVISEDEWAMLNELRGLLGIQPDQHALIEEAIRAMSEEDENGERRLARLARYNIVCPYS
jgi:tellurite resistance protein